MMGLLLPVLLPLGAAALCAALALWSSRSAAAALALGALANAAGFLQAARSTPARLELPLGAFGLALRLELAHDARLLLLLGAAALLVLVAAPAGLALRSARRPWALVAAVLLGTAALQAALLAADPFTLLVAWEALLPAIYLALVSQGAEAAAGRTLVELGAADLCLVAAAGILEHAGPGEAAHLPAAGLTGLALALAAVAALARLAVFPFHGWALRAAHEAPAPAAALLAGLLPRLAGLALLLRLPELFALSGWSALALGAVGALAAVAGALRTAAEADARRAAAHAAAALSGVAVLLTAAGAPLAALLVGVVAAGGGAALALWAATASPVPGPRARLAMRVRHTPGLSALARVAAADPLTRAGAAIDAVAGALFALERLLDAALARGLPALVRAAARLVVKGDGGDHARYVIWSLVGLALVVLVFVGGF